MKNYYKNENCFIKNDKSFKIRLLTIYIFLILNFCMYFKNEKEIKVALCTMGKNENLYVNEFVQYYSKLGIDHIFIYDDNDPETEKISDALDEIHKNLLQYMKLDYYILTINQKHFLIVITEI